LREPYQGPKRERSELEEEGGDWEGTATHEKMKSKVYFLAFEIAGPCIEGEVAFSASPLTVGVLQCDEEGEVGLSFQVQPHRGRGSKLHSRRGLKSESTLGGEFRGHLGC